MSLLVLGASGFIGSTFLSSGSPSDIFTSSRKDTGGCVKFDALHDELRQIDGMSRITHALILFAEREPDACVRNPAETARLNIEAALRVVSQCVSLGIFPIFASTELVFDGRAGNYRETSLPAPILEYGRQKRAVECELPTITQDHLILRFPKTVGTRRGDRSLFTNWIEEILRAPRLMRCAFDQCFSIQLVNDVPAIVKSLIEVDAKGIIHLGDGRNHSRLELLTMTCSKLQTEGFKIPEIEPVSIDELPFPEARPHDVSLNTSRLLSMTAYEAPSVDKVIDEAIKGCTPSR